MIIDAMNNASKSVAILFKPWKEDEIKLVLKLYNIKQNHLLSCLENLFFLAKRVFFES